MMDINSSKLIYFSPTGTTKRIGFSKINNIENYAFHLQLFTDKDSQRGIITR
jgi:hypothetical protein